MAASNDSNDVPPETYFKGFFAFALWGYINPPGFDHYKSNAMMQTTTDDKKLSRKVARTEEAERIEFDKLLDRRGELASERNKKKSLRS